VCVVIATKPVHRLQIAQCAQLEGIPMLHPGPCSSVGIRRGSDRHTNRHTDRHTDGRGQYTL